MAESPTSSTIPAQVDGIGAIDEVSDRVMLAVKAVQAI